MRHKYKLLKYSPINMKTNIDVIYTCYNKKEKYSQACLKGHLYITNHCPYRAPLYNKSLSIMGSLIFPLMKRAYNLTLFKGHLFTSM